MNQWKKYTNKTKRKTGHDKRAIKLGTSNFFWILGLFAGIIFLGARPIQAAVFTVNSTLDALDFTPDGVCETASGNGVCTLRAAIQEANAFAGGPHTIIILSGTYTLTLIGAGEDTNATGDLDILQSMTMAGAGQGLTTIDGNGTDRVLHVIGFVDLTLSGVTIRNGRTALGGGTYIQDGTLNLGDSTLFNNTATLDGGGIYSNTIGYVSLSTVLIDHNTADRNGGGIFNDGNLDIQDSLISNNLSLNGGGLYQDWYGISTLSTCTLTGNGALNNAGQGGGAIFNNGWVFFDLSVVYDNFSNYDGGALYSNYDPETTWGGLADITNVTFSANQATRNGGAIFNLNQNLEEVNLTNVTIGYNSASSGGGLWNDGTSGIISLTNTLIGKNTSGGDCSGLISSQGTNLFGDNTCGPLMTGDISGRDPLLGLLTNNGGPTLTHRLLACSPAIDKGTEISTVTTDQRQWDRVAPYDIGAYETQPGDPVCHRLHLPLVFKN